MSEATMHSKAKRLACWAGEFEVQPELGMFVKPDLWVSGEKLIECDDWDKADFRLRCYCCGDDLAVNIEITGYKLHEEHPNDMDEQHKVRVRITFVGDDEPDETTGGWMWIN